jgi:hypothetical protein
MRHTITGCEIPIAPRSSRVDNGVAPIAISFLTRIISGAIMAKFALIGDMMLIG